MTDLYCGKCNNEFELRSQKHKFGAKVVSIAFRTIRERIVVENNPHLMLLQYARGSGVNNLFVVPRHYFGEDIAGKRKPLCGSARRAGWVGCNIFLSRAPESGKIAIVREQIVRYRQSALDKWRNTTFLCAQTAASRGWLLNVLACVEQIGAKEFGLEEVYAFETLLIGLHPMNQRVLQKIRQQLPVLRGAGHLLFPGRGRYSLV